MPVVPPGEFEGNCVDADGFDTEIMRPRLDSRCRGLLETYSEVESCPDREELGYGPYPSEAPEISKVTWASQDIEQEAQPRPRQGSPSTTMATTGDEHFASLTALPWNAKQLIDHTNSQLCKEYIAPLITAKYYLKRGHLPPSTLFDLNYPSNLEDWLYSNSMWLSKKYGGNILEWIHMTLVLRQDNSGAPQLGLMSQWNETHAKLAEKMPEMPPHLLEKDSGLPVSQDITPTAFPSQEIWLATQEQRISNQTNGETGVETGGETNGFYWISHLHRTARDFLEKPQSWTRITLPTLNSGFDPHVAIFVKMRNIWKDDLLMG